MVFVIYQIGLGWETYECYYETDELPDPRPTQPPRKNWSKSGIFGPTFFRTATIFLWVGIGLCRKQTTRVLWPNQVIREHPIIVLSLVFVVVCVHYLLGVFVITVFPEDLVRLGFLYVVCFQSRKVKPIPTRDKLFAVGKRRPKCHFFTFFFGGLGWPWVGEFVGFMIMFLCFPTQQNLVNRKHPIYRGT